MKTLHFLTISAAALVSANAFGQSALPQFSLRGSDGKTHTRASVVAKPTVIVFLSFGCPHNPKHIGEFLELKRQLGNSVNVFATLNASQADARSYSKDLKLNFPILFDDKFVIGGAAKATHSLDFAVVAPRTGRILKTWNGVSRTHVDEAVSLLRRNGAPNINVNLARFGTALQSGCGL